MLSNQAMLMNNQEPSSSNTHEEELIREIHALRPPSPPTSIIPSRRFSNLSTATNSTDNFTTMSHEFNALLLAASPDRNYRESNDVVDDLEMIEEETNPLAIVPDNSSQRDPPENAAVNERRSSGGRGVVVSVQKVKEEEVEAKILAWQNAKVAKINNRFKREEAVINGWENEEVHKATSWMNKVERKLEEKRVKAMEKMQNEIAKAQRKAEERRATSEAKRGTKMASILEAAKFMRAIGKPPLQRRSFF